MRKGVFLGAGVCLVLVILLGCPNSWMGGYDGSQQVQLQLNGTTSGNASDTEGNNAGNGENSGQTSGGAEGSTQISIQVGVNTGTNVMPGENGGTSGAGGGSENGSGNGSPADGNTNGNTDAGSSNTGGQANPSADSGKDISYSVEGDSIKASTALEEVGTYNWYLGTYTEQDFATLTDDTIFGLYGNKLRDNKTGKSVSLSAQSTGQLGLILLIIDGNQKISHKFFQPVVVGKTDRVFVHSHQHGPDSNPNHMYFALRVKGSSSKESFRASVPGGYAYARDLHFQVYANQMVTQTYINFNGEEVDDLCSKYGICVDGYSDKTGFANESGTSFEFPFYFGYDDFRVAMSGSTTLKYEFEGFVVRDTTVKDTGIFGSGFAYPAFITMISSDRLTIEIPLKQAGKEYNPNIHKNIALLTVDFKDYDAAGKARPIITLDGFVSK